MAPSLHISAGPSVDKLQPIAVNHDDAPLEIDSPGFRGRATVRIKSFTGHDPDGVEHRKDSPYFNDKYRKGITWSIQLQGRFLKEISTDEVVFGNQFDKPIRDHLPYGTSVALQFVKVVDPNMKHDLYADSPWAFSPFIASMTHINIQRMKEDVVKKIESASSSKEERAIEGYPSFPSPETDAGKESVASQDGFVVDNTGALVTTTEGEEPQVAEQYSSLMDDTTFRGLSWPADDGANDHEALAARKRLFGKTTNRTKINFTPSDIWTADFANGYIDFNTLSLSIPGMTFDLRKYWDGQPVRYLCRSQSDGEIFFVVQFDIEDLDA